MRSACLSFILFLLYQIVVRSKSIRYDSEIKQQIRLQLIIIYFNLRGVAEVHFLVVVRLEQQWVYAWVQKATLLLSFL